MFALREKRTQKGSAETLERFRTGDSTRAQSACRAHFARAGLEPATPHKILASVATSPVAGRRSTTIEQILLSRNTLFKNTDPARIRFLNNN